MKLVCNCCDGLYNSLDVHFTSACDNRCAHCVDLCYAGLGIARPDISAITATIVANAAKIEDVLFLGGEPCLFLEELVDCVTRLRRATNLKLFVTTSVPEICFARRDLFLELLGLLDGANLSVQHYDERAADEIRRTVSGYNRQAFYSELPFKEKIRINLNAVRPWLASKTEIETCLRHYDALGFNSIKLSEIQHGEGVYVSVEKLLGLKLGPPYSTGCQTWIELPGIKTPVLLKRSCFLCEGSLKASLGDGVKAAIRLFNPARNNYGVVYEDGTLKKGWI